MTVEAGERPAPRPFVHEALLYGDLDEYLSSTVPFIEQGLAAGESVLVAVPAEKAELLARHVDQETDRLRVVPMESVGRNPAWIIAVWADFLADAGEADRGVRGIGEPIWPGRTRDELVECERHEALLNLAFADAAGFTLMCPYDTSRLDPCVIDEAEHNHPRLLRSGASVSSDRYDGDVPGWLESPLSPVPDDAAIVAFDDEPDHPWRALRRRTAELAVIAGLSPTKVDDVVLAVSEAVSNSVDHGGGGGQLAMWTDDDGFVCEISDRGRIADPLVGRIRPTSSQPDGRGLWLIHQLSDLAQLRILPDGQRLRMHFTR